ncbi:hypothetical protein V1460_14110 [Streptomyces sp. SCSIO 30461]|uniref:hypothetical protein n=1 Tax=Streptomyces sp. SCSIO 30461 TaxID=3118085 RepID=UPI0030D0EABD
MRFAQLRPGGLMRTYRPDWELTLIRIGSSRCLWRWNQQLWSYEVADDARRADPERRVGYLGVVPPAAPGGQRHAHRRASRGAPTGCPR